MLSLSMVVNKQAIEFINDSVIGSFQVKSSNGPLEPISDTFSTPGHTMTSGVAASTSFQIIIYKSFSDVGPILFIK